MVRFNEKSFRPLLVGLVLSLSSAACSTIIKGQSQSVSIDSNVQGADVTVEGNLVGTTPYTGPISRGSSTTVKVSKNGYRSKTVTLSTEIEPIFFGNIIFGGFLGSSTDAGSGAMYKYSPATIQVDLVPEGK